jgi:hypothetical protein
MIITSWLCGIRAATCGAVVTNEAVCNQCPFARRLHKVVETQRTEFLVNDWNHY